MTKLYDQLYDALLINDVDEKCSSVRELYNRFCNNELNLQWSQKAKTIITPGLPLNLKMVPPRQLKRRGIQSQTGRNSLMHAIAHIEFNAINLALDAAYRFRDLPREYTADWIKIAHDEAKHFVLIKTYLNNNDCDYGDYPVHNGLWQTAVDTAHDVVARMALVPRVLEARGLDVTPSMIERLKRVQDHSAVNILEIIYQDEISHVEKGSYWFQYVCNLEKLEPKTTFLNMIDQYLHGALKGPFNENARLAAGFDQTELDQLNDVSNDLA